MGSGDMTSMGKQLIGYIDWAIAENAKPASAYYNSLDTKKIAANGFSCGGLMAIGTVGDPRDAPLPPDDDVDCDCDDNGAFGADGHYCNGQVLCVHVVCGYTGDPCPAGLTCDEANNECDCNGNEDCADDGLFCNGV